ncbi:MAG: alpha/beta hydrolase, partial [Myxococcota bacterium]
LAWDAPGCGESRCSDLTQVTIPFLVKTALETLERLGFERFHLAGHAMGGLTALMLADARPDRVLSFTSIEGNLAPEDCFLSRQIVAYANPDPVRFLAEFEERARRAPDFASALFASSLPHKVRAEAVRPIFTSMVELSDHGGLMERFLRLPCPKMFMHGDQNRGLSYLSMLEREGVRRAEIPACGHFPMYSNPTAMWEALASFWGSE